MGIDRLSVKVRLMAGFMLLAVIVLAVATLSVRSLKHEHDSFSQYAGETSLRVTLANNILDAANARAIGVRNLVLVAAPAAREQERSATTAAHGQVIEGFFLTPRLVGHRIGLHPVAVIFVLLACGQLFGILGVLLALPLSAVGVVVLRRALQSYRHSRFYLDAGADPGAHRP